MKLFEYTKIAPYRCCSWALSPQSLEGWGGGTGLELEIEQGRLLFVMSSF